MTDAWRSRIVGYAEVDPRELVANPRNWRSHPDHQRAALHGVLDEVGWVAEVLVNQRTGFVVDGHLRVASAVQHGEQSVPVRYVDLDESEERLVLATLDPLSAMAEQDAAALDELLGSVATEDLALQRMLESLRPGEPTDVSSEWQGMPEFEQEDAFGVLCLKVRFLTDEDVARFSALVGQPVTRQTKSIWFPQQNPALVKHLGYVSES